MGEHGKKRALPLTTILCALTAGLRFLCDSSDLFSWCLLLPQPAPSPNSASFHEGEMQSHISERKLARGCICSAGSAKLLPFSSYRGRELCGAGRGREPVSSCVCVAGGQSSPGLLLTSWSLSSFSQTLCALLCLGICLDQMLHSMVQLK